MLIEHKQALKQKLTFSFFLLLNLEKIVK